VRILCIRGMTQSKSYPQSYEGHRAPVNGPIFVWKIIRLLEPTSSTSQVYIYIFFNGLLQSLSDLGLP
jgi:hypothetical protein